MKRFFCLFSFGFFGCLLSPTVTVELRLPPLPTVFQSLDSVKEPPPATVIWESGAGVFEKKEFVYGQRLAVEMWKGEGALVWVLPLYGLRPYGGFYRGQRQIELTWKGGFLAETLSHLTYSQRKGINLSLLEKQINGNPWLINTNTLLNALETRTLNRYSLKKRPLVPVHLKTIPAGMWFNRYPHDFIKVEEDQLFEAELPLGHEQFYHLEKKLTLSLYVQENGQTAFILKECEW